jgi:hypothetical protein
LKGDHGAVATIVVILSAAGLLLTGFAMTSDASALYRERVAIQSAADQSSLAVSSFCALGSSQCASSVSLESNAQEFANLNSDDGASLLTSLCGFTPMTPCSSQSTTKCKTIPSGIQRYNRLTLGTKNKDGSTTISTPFLNALTGKTISDKTGTSCAQSAWGKANSANVPIPIAITICDYQNDGFKILRDYSTQLTECPTTIYDVQGLVISPQPKNVINGWAIFAPTGEALYCLIPKRLVVGTSIDTLPPGQERCNDASLSGSDSKRALSAFISANLGKKIFIPVIASTSGAGSGQAQRVTSTVVGFYTFIFLGYDFGSQIKDGCGSISCTQFAGVSAANCGSRDACIWGQFSRGIVPGASVSRDTTFPPVGSSAVELLP